MPLKSVVASLSFALPLEAWVGLRVILTLVRVRIFGNLRRE
jgi:hypothetical protein